MANVKPEKSVFVPIRDQIKNLINNRGPKYYGIAIQLKRPDIDSRLIYNVMNKVDPVVNWEVLRELGALVGVVVVEPKGERELAA